MFQSQLKGECGDKHDFINANIIKFDDEFQKDIRQYKIQVFRKLFIFPNLILGPNRPKLQNWTTFDIGSGSEWGQFQNWASFRVEPVSELSHFQNCASFRIGQFQN